jgi:predicted permease
MRDDLRYAARGLRRSPAFTATAILTLALGIGANTAIFGLIDGFARPLPVPDADRIVVLATTVPGDENGLRYRFSFPALVDFRRQDSAFSHVFAFDVRMGGLGLRGTTSNFVYHAVTGNFFTSLGLQPAVGRLFNPGDGERAGAPLEVVLGYSHWQTRFGGDPNVAGTVVRLDGQFATVIGVAPQGFHGLFNAIEADGYTTLGAVSTTVSSGDRLFEDRSEQFLTAVARLKPGVTLAAAQEAASGMAARIAATYPYTDGGTSVRVVPETLARPVPLPFFERYLPGIKLLMLVLAAVVLAIACMNVTNLLLVRATARQHEMAVRTALGSAPGRLVSLVLTEASLLAALGTLAGVAIGRGVLAALLASLDLEAFSQTTGLTVNLALADLDWPVFAYAAALAIGSVAVMAVVPAWRAATPLVNPLLHQGGRTQGGGSQRLRATLVVAQVAGSLVLLVVSVLLVRNLQQAQRIDLGFDPSHVVTLRIDPRHVGYDRARAVQFFDELDRRLAALPGVERVAQSFTVPLSYVVGGGSAVEREGQVLGPDEPLPVVGYNTVSPGYFETLRLPVIHGRGFTADDAKAQVPVAVVSDAFAARMWPGQDAIGRRFRMDEGSQGWRQVVGVVRDAKYIAVFESTLPHFYVPIVGEELPMRTILVRATVPPDTLAAMVRAEILALDPTMSLTDITAMERTVSGNIGFLLFRIGAFEAASLGLLGLVLAVVGLYGVVSYSASQQTRSIGIRMALGAGAAEIRRLVLTQGVRLVAMGTAFGLIGTIAVIQAIKSMLVVVETADPLLISVVTALLVAVALVACYLPARRATRVDPVVVLRSE